MRLFTMSMILLSPVTDGGGGAGDGDKATTETKGGANIAPADYTAAVRETERFRTLYEETKGKLPPEGSRVLTAAEVKAFEAYSKLGLKPEDITTRLAERDTFHGQVTAFARDKHLGQVCEATGYKPAVLARLAGAELVIDLKDGTVNGKPGKVAEVVTTAKGADGPDVVTRTPLTTYAETHWPEFLPSLKGTPAPAPIGTPRIAPGRVPATPAPGAERPATRRRASW